MPDKTIKVTFSDTSRPPFSLSGQDIGYKISPTEAPGCLKVYSGNETHIWPLHVVFSFYSVM